MASKPTVGTLPQVNPLSGMRFRSSGPSGSPYFKDDLQLLAFYPGALPDSTRLAILR